jgi:acetyl/propionyl-CoA carboxylase alpha subunit
MTGHVRPLARYARRWERCARRGLSAIPASLIIATALGSAWLIQQHARRMEAATSGPTPCLHVVTTPRDGRLAWVMDADGAHVRSGDVVARFETHDPDGGLRSPFSGAVRTVVRKAGDAVRKGDPILIVGSIRNATCP